MSQIQWTEKTWNPIVGCRRVSAGCENCYAEREVHRRASIVPQHAGLTVVGKNGVRWNGEYNLAEHRLDEPLRRKKPTTYFVNSLSDLFFEPLPFELIAAIFGVMAACPQHTFQVLTKRPARAVEFFAWLRALPQTPEQACLWRGHDRTECRHEAAFAVAASWPLPNVHLGVSVENQATADERIPLLLKCPAALRWVSYEPALGPVDFGVWIGPWTCCNGCGSACPTDHDLCLSCGRDDAITTWGDAQRRRWLSGERYAGKGHSDLLSGPPLGWIVVGGESGNRARPFDLAWARSTIEQCKAAGVPVFVKQLGAKPLTTVGTDHAIALSGVPTLERLKLQSRKGDDMDEWPEDLRVREMPAERERR